jgi:hypothetical protein
MSTYWNIVSKDTTWARNLSSILRGGSAGPDTGSAAATGAGFKADTRTLSRAENSLVELDEERFFFLCLRRPLPVRSLSSEEEDDDSSSSDDE